MTKNKPMADFCREIASLIENRNYAVAVGQLDYLSREMKKLDKMQIRKQMRKGKSV